MKKVYVVLSSHGSYDDHYKKVECVCANPIFAEGKKVEIENKYREETPFPFDWCTEQEFLDLDIVADEHLNVYDQWWVANNQREEFNCCLIQEVDFYEQP
jgi:hypothetical protein